MIKAITGKKAITAFSVFLAYITVAAFITLSPLWCGEPVPMEALEKPDSVLVDHRHMYITDQASVFIYSLDDYKLKKRFGKAGEGPGEFKVRKLDRIGLFLSILDKELLVNSWGRVSYFSPEGEFLRQKTLSFPIQVFKPVGQYYAGYKKTIEDRIAYANVLLYDRENFKVSKVVYRKLWTGRIKNQVDLIWLARTLKDPLFRGPRYETGSGLLFIEGTQNEIHVFSGVGEKQYTIPDRYEKVPISDSFRKKVHVYLKKRLPTAYAGAKRNGYFEEYFPMRWFRVVDGKLFVMSFKREADKSLCYISDLSDKKGGNVKQTWLPFDESEFLVPYPFTVGNGKIYQIREDEDSGDWELRVSGIGERFL